MSQYEDKPGEGTVWVTNSSNPRAPKLSGDVTQLDGKKVRVAMWYVTNRETDEKRRDKNGNPFFHVKLTVPDESYERAAAPATDDDLPI